MTKENKNSAQPLPDNGESVNDRGKEGDEADEILKAHDKHVQKFG